MIVQDTAIQYWNAYWRCKYKYLQEKNIVKNINFEKSVSIKF